VVWVGFDNNRDLDLEGSKSALPIWTEFMKRAQKLADYGSVKPFVAPSGIVTAEICNESGQLASPYCDSTHTEGFIDGTQPAVECQMHNGVPAQVVINGQVLPSQGTADRLLVPMPERAEDRGRPPN
jgi:penicillin-binding protein 1B